MIRRSIAFMLFVSAASVAVSGQTPEPKRENGRAPMVFGWPAEGAGGYLGVQTKEVNAENFASFGLSAVRGVAVEKVMEGSPAEKSQLQKGDVIVRFGSEEVTSGRKLTRLVNEVAPDHQVTLTVIRGGTEQNIPVTIGKRAVPEFREGAFTMAVPGTPGALFPDVPEFRGDMPNVRVFPSVPGGGSDVMIYRGSSRRIGINVIPMTKQLADHFGVKSGVMISDVREGSPAAKANLKAGDIIVEVDGKEVIGEGDIVRAISEKKEGDVSLTIVRKGDRRTVNVTPEEVKDVYERLIGPDAPTPVRPMAPSAMDQLLEPGRYFIWPRKSNNRAIIAPKF